MLTGEVKKILIKILVDKVESHQQERSKVTEDIVDAFMSVRDMTDCFKVK